MKFHEEKRSVFVFGGRRPWVSHLRIQRAPGARPPTPLQDYFQNHAVFRQFWANFGLRSPPPLGSKLRWAPLTKILDPPLVSEKVSWRDSRKCSCSSGWGFRIFIRWTQIWLGPQKHFLRKDVNIAFQIGKIVVLEELVRLPWRISFKWMMNLRILSEALGQPQGVWVEAVEYIVNTSCPAVIVVIVMDRPWSNDGQVA